MIVLRLKEGWQVLLYFCQWKVMKAPHMLLNTRLRMSRQIFHPYLETVEQNRFLISGETTEYKRWQSSLHVETHVERIS